MIWDPYFFNFSIWWGRIYALSVFFPHARYYTTLQDVGWIRFYEKPSSIGDFEPGSHLLSIWLSGLGSEPHHPVHLGTVKLAGMLCQGYAGKFEVETVRTPIIETLKASHQCLKFGALSHLFGSFAGKLYRAVDQFVPCDGLSILVDHFFLDDSSRMIENVAYFFLPTLFLALVP